MKSLRGPFVAVVALIAVPALAQSSGQASGQASGQTSGQSSDQSSTQSSTTPTLSELARRMQEKKTAAPAIRTFTNDDLKNATTAADDGTAADAKTGKTDKTDKADNAKDSDKPADAKSGDAAKKEVDPTKTEKYWRDRMSAAREELRRNQSFAEALQSRINALTAEFSARDDPYQRAKIGDDRQKALEELDRVNKAIDDNNKAIAAVEDDARKAMVPAGWIR